MSKKIVTVIGARPQIIKAAAISRAIRKDFHDRISEVIVHTGQHYDAKMSEVFFTEMDIPTANYNLGVGSASHAQQTGAIMEKLEPVLQAESPHAVLVYGDTNSTLAAALTASKMNIPVVHVEAGLRSFDKTMPEEINRIATDHVSTILFAPTDTAVTNLVREGFGINNTAPYSFNNPLVRRTGDVMYDNALFFGEKMQQAREVSDEFILATIHRDHNTDDANKLKELFHALGRVHLETNMRIVFPIHPRTKRKVEDEMKLGWTFPQGIDVIEPLSYLGMIELESKCKLVITDSGGVQKEAYFFRKPCIILRPHTEWVEIVRNGNALLVGNDTEKMLEGVHHFLAEKQLTWPNIFGDGHAAEDMCNVLLMNI